MRVNMEKEGRSLAVYLNDGTRLGELEVRDPDPEPGRYALEDMLEAIRTEAKEEVSFGCPKCHCLACMP